MTAESCVLFPNATVDGEELKDASGEPIPSQLWDQLVDMCMRIPGTEEESLTQAVSLWKLAHYSPFLNEHSKELRYSTVNDGNGNLSRGEVTFTSFMNVVYNSLETITDERGEEIDLAEVPSALYTAFITKTLDDINKELVPNPENPPSMAQQVRRAVSKVEELGRNGLAQIGDDQYVSIRYVRSRGNRGKKVGVEIYLTDNPSDFEDFVKHSSRLVKLQDFLNKKGLDYTFLKEEESNVYTDDVDGSRKAYEHLQGVISVVTSEAAQEELTYKRAAQILSYILNGTPLYKRILDNLTEEQFIEYLRRINPEIEHNVAVKLYSTAAFINYQPVMAEIIYDALTSKTSSNVMLRLKNLIAHLPFQREDARALRQSKIEVEKAAKALVKKVFNNKFTDEEEATIEGYIHDPEIYSSESPFGSAAALSDPYIVQAKIALNKLAEIGEDLGRLRRSDLNRFLKAYKSAERPILRLRGLNKDISVTIVQNVCRTLESEYDKIVRDLSRLNFDKEDVSSKNATTLYQAALFIDKIKELRETLGSTIELLSTDSQSASAEEAGFIARMKEAKSRLDYFLKSEGGNKSIEEAIETKTAQWVAKFAEDIYGKPYVQMAGGIVWGTVNNKRKLKRVSNTRRFFGKADAIAYRDAYRSLMSFIDLSFATEEEKIAALNSLSPLAQQLYKEEIEDLMSYGDQKAFLEERLAASTEEQNTALTEVLTDNVGWISSMMYSMMYSGDIMNQFKDYAVKQQKAEANILTAKEIQEINSLMLELKQIEQNRLGRAINLSDASTRKFAEVDENGIRTGYFVTPYNLGKWHEDFEKAKLEWTEQFYADNPKYRAMPNDNPIKRLDLDAYINKQKRRWHRSHSHWDENLQQYLPGVKVKITTPESPTPADLFYTESEQPIDIADFNNNDSTFDAITDNDSKFRNARGEINRTSGYYQDNANNKWVRFHRLQEVDSQGRRIPSSQEIEKLSEENGIRSSELGSRTDAFLRVIFDTKGADFNAAVAAANAEQVELLDDMQPKFFDINNAKDKAYLNKLYSGAVNLMRIWAAKGIKWKTTNLVVNTSIGGLKIAGEMDVLLKYPDETFEVWDMKTTDKDAHSEHSPELNVNYEAQLNFYTKALRDAGHKARVGGILKINSSDGDISLAARTDTKFSDLKLSPFNLKDRSQKRITLREAIEAQLAVEEDAVKDNSIFEEEPINVYDELAEAKEWQVIAYVEEYHPSYTKAVKAFFEHSYNQSPLGVLKRFGLYPKSASDILNLTKASEEAGSTNYTINYLNYKSPQWSKLSVEEQSWMMKLLDLKTRMDSKYPSVPYGLMPQFGARGIEKVRAYSNLKSDIIGGLNPLAWVKAAKRGILNSLVSTADDYEFGDASTFNGDELTSLVSMKGLARDRLQRMPILGVNHFIHSYDARRQRDLEWKINRTKNSKERKKYQKQLINLRRDASKEMTTEIFHSMAAYSVMTNNYICMRSIVDAMEVCERVMHNRKDYSSNSLEDPKTGTKRQKSQKRALEQSRVYLNKELYNIHTRRLALGPILINKVINVVGALSSVTTIAGNPMAAITNKKVGKALTFDESIIKEHYTVKEWLKAESIWLNYIWTKAWFSPSSESGRTHIAVGDDLKQDKLSLFLRWSDSQRKVSDTYMKYNPQKSKLRKTNPFTQNTFYMPFELGDAYMQGMSALAGALHIKLFDTTTGKEISLWDALIHDKSRAKKTGMGELTVKEGVIKDKKDWELYYNILENIKNEREKINEEQERLSSGEVSLATRMLIKDRIAARRKHIKELDEQLESITWQDTDTNNFSIYIGNVNVGLHGVYNSIDRAQFQYSIYGKMISVMRGYALGNMHRVFGSRNIQLSLKDIYGNPKDFEGEMSAAFKALAYLALGAKDETPYNLNKSYNFMERFWAVIASGHSGYKGLEEQGFSKGQVYALRRFNVHIWHLMLRAVWLGMLNRWLEYLLAHIKTKDDDNKEKEVEEFTEAEEVEEFKEVDFELNLDDSDASKEEKAKLQWDYKQFLHNLTAIDPELVLYRLLGIYHGVETRTQYESMAFLTPKGLLTEIPQVFDATPLGASMFFRLLSTGGELLNKDVYAKDPSSSLEINKPYQAGDSKGIIHAMKMIPWIRFTFTWIDPESYTKSYVFYRMVSAGLRTSGEDSLNAKFIKFLTGWVAPKIEENDNSEDDSDEIEELEAEETEE